MDRVPTPKRAKVTRHCRVSSTNRVSLGRMNGTYFIHYCGLRDDDPISLNIER